MSNPNQQPEVTSTPERGRDLLARKWAYLMSGVVVVPLSNEELTTELRGMLDVLCSPADLVEYEVVGERLVALGYVGEAGLRVTMSVLGKGMLALPEFQPVANFADRVVAALGSLASGFVAANQRAVFEQQESMQLSLLKAVRDAKWNLRASEARFDEVATSSASGIMMLDLDARLVRANAALADMLGIAPSELTGMSLFDLVHPDGVAVLRDAVSTLLLGEKERIRQAQRLLREGGDVARISLTVSLLRDADDRPEHFVAVVEDGTELMLLQSELNRQALHDVLTGLPNRQFFSTNLESALRRADPVHGITVLHLDLDAFGMVCNSLGRRVGERLLVHVAQRLKAVLAREKSMVARFDGDEFGILVENTATTPDIAIIVADINRELAEPIFVDGNGLAVSASIGVVHQPSRDTEPAELLRAADQTLRRAKTGRRGQWELFHPDTDAHDRRVQALAVTMPGAWEHGEISVLYRPVARLADGGVAAVEAVLNWDRAEEPLPHKRCVELAEQTGLILQLGEWLLGTACGQATWWPDLTMVVGLTAHQACDSDLVSRVRRVLGELPATRLMLGMPVSVLRAPDAVDNLGVLADMGIRMGLDSFGCGPADLAALADLPVSFVRVSASLASVRPVDVMVIVDSVELEGQASRWRSSGATLASGALFGSPGPARSVAQFF